MIKIRTLERVSSEVGWHVESADCHLAVASNLPLLFSLLSLFIFLYLSASLPRSPPALPQEKFENPRHRSVHPLLGYRYPTHSSNAHFPVCHSQWVRPIIIDEREQTLSDDEKIKSQQKDVGHEFSAGFHRAVPKHSRLGFLFIFLLRNEAGPGGFGVSTRTAGTCKLALAVVGGTLRNERGRH